MNNFNLQHIINNISIIQILNNLNPEDTELDLSGRGLTDLNIRIFDFEQLEYLDLSNNQLTFLPPQIGNLSNLINLFLSNNQLTTLPEEIWNIRELGNLDLSNNQLTSLPRITGNRELAIFNLSENPNLKRLPNSIVRLTVTEDFIPPENLETDSPRPIIIEDNSDNNSGNNVPGA